MINGFSRDLIMAKNELTALKTAHRHGLGRTAFYQKTVVVKNLPSGSRFTRGTLTVVYNEDSPFPPISRLSALVDPTLVWTGLTGIVAGSNEPVFDENTHTATYDVRLVSEAGGDMTLLITSASSIKSMSWVGR